MEKPIILRSGLHLKALLFLLSILAYASCNNNNNKQQSMAIEISDNWSFRQAGTETWLPASVPGTVHTDLISNGVIKDPFYRMQENELQWIETQDWEYHVSFDVSPEMLAHDMVMFNFKGLDTYADVYLNDKLILQANNMFVGWEVACREQLVAGSNELRIYFHSPVVEGLKKLRQLDYLIPAINEQAPVDERTNIFTRKAPFHYGWDWGPRLVTSGIWRPVWLTAWNKARIEDIYLETLTANSDLAQISSLIDIEAIRDGNYTLELYVNGIRAGHKKQLKLEAGHHQVAFDFDINNPQLWWTNGLGEAHLYDFSFRLHDDNGPIFKYDIAYGIRTLKLVQNPDEAGHSFYFELNGIPVFMKGANVIPSETLTPAVTIDTYQQMITNAVAANMNMFRVWGGAIYEEDLFYSLCDQHGILVWQDFMFACNLQPGDEAHLENIRREAVYNVKRLRNHACLALWCGNNENLHGWHHWGWKEAYEPEVSDFVWRTYERIFYEILPETVAKYDPKNSYWASSPSSINDQLADRKSGDEHDWTIWFGQKPFSAYNENVPRFVSEWGMQAMPPMQTIRSFAEPGDLDMNSPVMRHRQRSKMDWYQPGFDGNDMIKWYMEMYYKVPEHFENFAYVSQLLQAKGYKTAIEAHRRAMPYCMGSLYWQLNDCWPTISWASLDYYNRWKASHYAVKKAFENLIVSALEENDNVAVYAVSDKLTSMPAKLHIKLIDFQGKIHYDQQTDVEVPANSSKKIFDLDINGLPDFDEWRDKLVLHVALITEDEVIADNMLYFTEPKNMVLPEAEVQFELSATKTGYVLSVISETLVKNLFIDCPDPDAFMSDNYFDLLPGQNKILEIKTAAKLSSSDITMKSLNNLY